MNAWTAYRRSQRYQHKQVKKNLNSLKSHIKLATSHGCYSVVKFVDHLSSDQIRYLMSYFMGLNYEVTYSGNYLEVSWEHPTGEPS